MWCVHIHLLLDDNGASLCQVAIKMWVRFLDSTLTPNGNETTSLESLPAVQYSTRGLRLPCQLDGCNALAPC